MEDMDESAASPSAAGADRWSRALARLGCSRTELVALAVLAAAALAALGLLAVAIVGAPRRLPGLQAPVADPAGPAQPLAIQSEPPSPVVVHVAGRVAAPGVYRLAAGARVGDALTVAGGALADAALEALNLARQLGDGEQVWVPAIGDPAATPPPATGAVGGEPATVQTPLDLNRATQAELERLPGVGPVLAGRILEHRARLGGRFASVGDLRDVPGIGETRFQALAELVRV